MTTWVRVLVPAAEAVLLGMTAVVTVIRLREPREKNGTANLSPLAVLFLVIGGLFTLPTLTEKGLPFAFLVVPLCLAALAAANARLRWDAGGFTWRTMLGRERTYRYEDIRWVRRVGGRWGRDLFLRAGHRLIALDNWMDWAPFMDAYDNWRTRLGREGWREQERARWLERYRRHGAFGRKLDRISGGRAMLAGVLAIGLVFLGLAAVCLWAPVRPGQERLARIAAAMMLLVAIGFPTLYVWAVAHLNKRVLRHYLHCPRIRPDPLQPRRPKRYRRKK